MCWMEVDKKEKLGDKWLGDKSDVGFIMISVIYKKMPKVIIILHQVHIFIHHGHLIIIKVIHDVFSLSLFLSEWAFLTQYFDHEKAQNYF